ncbi:hypothetical protein P6P90_02995 [Ectobacillus antri]|uniref:Uncharacterized protein n=1 Tax=Ectobacillus antri TaxID=2486280 RepID=A0ABT6H3F0_9BACI|nr:hypothetical protein [Ectobacillus antri]MDG4656291.1 hypothetical protein [Ectobacillus antri]MDG5752966.1 hypothetical protein [Ectobacillus antri]
MTHYIGETCGVPYAESENNQEPAKFVAKSDSMGEEMDKLGLH